MQLNRRAFSVVEMFIGVAIFVILLAVVVQFAHRYRDSAARSSCVNQLRQIMSACRAYADDNQGYIPEYRDGPQGDFSVRDSNMLIDFSSTPPAVPDFGLGRLVLTGYLPLQTISADPGRGGPMARGNNVRVPYYFNPHPAHRPGGEAGLTTRYKRLADFPELRSVVTDFFFDIETLPHGNRDKKILALNLAFADGHVATPQSSRAYSRLELAGQTNWAWSRVCDIVGTLEYEATTLDPKFDYGQNLYDPLDPPADE